MQQLELYDIQSRLLKKMARIEDSKKHILSIENLPAGRCVVKAIEPFRIAMRIFEKQ